MPTNVGSRRSSHAVKQLSVTKDDSFEEEQESEDDVVNKLIINLYYYAYMCYIMLL